jgi:quinol monooxygenase YgiN
MYHVKQMRDLWNGLHVKTMEINANDGADKFRAHERHLQKTMAEDFGCTRYTVAGNCDEGDACGCLALAHKVRAIPEPQ